MTEEQYRAHPGVNKSTLWELRKSPAHYKRALEEPLPETPALKLGRAAHMAALQPRKFGKTYVVAPAIDRRTKDGKAAWEAFTQRTEGREIISQEDRDLCKTLAKAARGAAGDLLKGCKMERPLFWRDQETGILCKCRVDAMKPGVVIDLKTCADASHDAFVRDALRYGYDVQAAHYLHGVHAHNGDAAVEWYFIAVEKTPPHAVNILRASDEFLDHGEWQLLSLMRKLKECQDADSWPGYGTNTLILPAWADTWEV